MLHRPGTAFTMQTISSEAQLHETIIANFSPPVVPQSDLFRTADKLLELYPDVPALGCPFNTGNETFGLSSQFKRAAALCEFLPYFLAKPTANDFKAGDIGFHSQRRLFQQIAARAGVKTWGYLFTQPQPTAVVPAFLGGKQSFLHLLNSD